MKRFAFGAITTLLLAGCAATQEVLDTAVLLRWGHGAFDWLLPDPPGDNRHERDRKHSG